MLDTDTAEKAQQAVARQGKDWYDRSGLFDKHGNVQSSRDTGRNRAFTHPAAKVQTDHGTNEESGNIPVVEEAASSPAVNLRGSPTSQAWRVDMGTVGSIFDSMLAEDDHGRI